MKKIFTYRKRLYRKIYYDIMIYVILKVKYFMLEGDYMIIE